jgi:uncharacterized protein (TIGR00299 family) protein
MKMLTFEPFSGASGDMITGCLIDLGADASVVRENMESVADVNVEILPVKKSGISATWVKVISNTRHIRYTELLDIIRSSGISETMSLNAQAIFDIIAWAESNVHESSLEDLMFHEVGAADALADVVGACTAIALLNPGRIHITPICVGGGIVQTQHGILPVPTPATIEILSRFHLVYKGGPAEGELLTPTGAAILSHFAHSSNEFLPQMRVEKVGYGAGSRDYACPNVLRATLGEPDEALLSDEVEVLETNVDDVTGEVLGNLIDELLQAGARDVSIIPTTGKKGRSGHLVQVVASPSDSHALAKRLIEETGTLGVRIIPTRHRLIALRHFEHVEIAIGGATYDLSIKVATDRSGKVLNVSAEFEEAKAIAKKLNIPVRLVIHRAEQECWSRLLKR